MVVLGGVRFSYERGTPIAFPPSRGTTVAAPCPFPSCHTPRRPGDSPLGTADSDPSCEDAYSPLAQLPHSWGYLRSGLALEPLARRLASLDTRQARLAARGGYGELQEEGTASCKRRARRARLPEVGGHGVGGVELAAFGCRIELQKHLRGGGAETRLLVPSRPLCTGVTPSQEIASP